MSKAMKLSLAIAIPVVVVVGITFWNINNPNYNPAQLSGMLTGIFFLCAVFAVLAYIAQNSARNAHNDRPLPPPKPQRPDERSFDPVPKDFMPKNRK